MKNNSKQVFISHSSKDKSFVDRLVSDFARNGIPVWYDKLEIKIGDSIPGKINEGISEAKYFLIVLSPNSVNSKWVQEELNAALMRQIASAGTFLIPVLLQDCDVPPLLNHRHYADFRGNYVSGLNQLLDVWGQDTGAVKLIGDKLLFPWPDLEASDREFVYLHSTRFDKFFRMACDLNWMVEDTIDYIIETLKLPWEKTISELGMRWSFSYGLVHEDNGLSLSSSLRDAGIDVGSVVQISINGTYVDLYKDQLLSPMWVEDKIWHVRMDSAREPTIVEKINARGELTRERLKQIADSCFSHV